MENEEQMFVRGMQAVVYACLRHMSESQQAMVRDDLIQLSDAASIECQPKTAELIRELAKAAESARKRILPDGQVPGTRH